MARRYGLIGCLAIAGVLVACRATTAKGPASTSAAALVDLTDAVGAVPRPPVREAGLPSLLAEASHGLPTGLRDALANKPSPYVVKAHDVGGPTGFDTDIPWHTLEKEKDDRFRLPHFTKLGVVNTNSDVNLLIGFGVNGGAVTFDPPRRFTDHLVNLVAQEATLGDVRAHVLFLPVRSDTLLAIVQMRNTSSGPAVVALEAVCTKTPNAAQPFDRYGYGIHVTTGRKEWLGYDPINGAAVCSFEEWQRDTREPRRRGSLLCTLAGSDPSVTASSQSAEDDGTNPGSPGGMAQVSLRFDVPLAADQARTLAVALNLHRYGPERFETRQQIVLYPGQTKDEALRQSIRSAVGALGADWPGLVRDSYRWYERMPVARLDRPSWTADLACALELPRGNTWSAQGVLQQPWYTFCRVHGHNPYGWWSYGMHAHEHLTTFVVNLTEPSLSQAYLRGHFQVRGPDGFIQYGVNHRGENCIHTRIATCPFLAHEAWSAYLWSGDRAFLAEARAACGPFVRWWRSPARTRGPVALQHWQDDIESARDDADLATWTATGKAAQQEALDLNCYLLNEERTLAAMARELGEDNEAAAWETDAERRSARMRGHLWHDEDRVYYGRDLIGDRWARVMDISTFFPLWCGLATDEQAPRFVELLHDPQAFGTEFPAATLAVRHMPEKLRGQWHWRGANWVQMTWLVIQGLKRYGRYDEAARLAEVNCRMVFDTLEKSGHFREFYNSLTGAPSDLTDYIWTSMPAIMAIEVFFGVRPTAEGVEVLPALPAGWATIRIDNLHVRGTRLSIVVDRDPQANATAATVNEAPWPVREDRGVFIKWSELPAEAVVRITQSRQSAGSCSIRWKTQRRP